MIPYFLLSICMKRYDGRTKPIPKPRPAKKKGVSILSCSNVSHPYLPSNFASHLDTGEAAEPQDPTCLSPTPRTLRVHVPCQVLWNSLALKLIVCFRAVFKNEKISTVIHSKEVRNFAWKWLGNKTFFFLQVNKFQLAYCNLLKSNMDGLKRQKKQKTKKATQ